MNRNLMLSLVAAFIGSIITPMRAMEESKRRSNMSYSTQVCFTLTTLADDVGRGKKGNKKSKAAINDFIASCKNRNYIMRKSSVNILHPFHVLDDQNKIAQKFIVALKEENLFDKLTASPPKKLNNKRPGTA